jgi:hypothetical protein
MDASFIILLVMYQLIKKNIFLSFTLIYKQLIDNKSLKVYGRVIKNIILMELKIMKIILKSKQT